MAKIIMSKHTNPLGACFLMFVSAFLAGGCTSHTEPATSQPMTTAYPAPGQQRFETPEEAANAVIDAAKAQDQDAMQRIFGPDLAALVSGDPQQENHDFKSFAGHAAEGVQWVQTSPTSADLLIGKNQWPFPIPLVRASANDKWYFNTPAGQSTILARRIGHNELNTIAVCHEYVLAQRQYAGEYHDKSDVYQYAQRLTSRSEKHDGLYWPADDSGEGQSPFGPLAQAAAEEGYSPPKGAARAPFHGYYFRVLKQQGPQAPGGAYSYVINGNMIAGFALIAYPAQYGNTGVMTFIVSHNGMVYQKDLGPNTVDEAEKIRTYNPDSSWTAVHD